MSTSFNLSIRFLVLAHMVHSFTQSKIHTVLKNQDGVEKLLDYVHLPDISNLAQTSRDLANAVHLYRQHTWDINKFLNKWFTSPQSFRKTLRTCDAILHDTAVRKFLDRDTQSPRLDILLSLEGLHTMGSWLELSGYTMTPHLLPTITNQHRGTSSISTLCINLAIHARIVHLVEERHLVSVMFKNRKNPTIIVVVSVARKDPIADILNSHSSQYYTTLNRCKY